MDGGFGGAERRTGEGLPLVKRQTALLVSRGGCSPGAAPTTRRVGPSIRRQASPSVRVPIAIRVHASSHPAHDS